ncbi:MAG: SDR family NAD(P)-dependent oxidoreductase [Acidimicrobiia bacterium]
MSWSVLDQNVLITGGNSGIGAAAAEGLAAAGARVTITARDIAKGKAAAAKIEDSTGSAIEVLELDLADLESVRRSADEFQSNHDSLAVLVNNAGGFFGSRSVTPDGFETTLGTNYLGPFLFTNLLTDLLISSAPSRIINVASSAHGAASDGIRFDDLMAEDSYKMMPVYGHSKLANILHARQLDTQLGASGVHAFSMHPGVVRTSIGQGGDSWLVALGVQLLRWRLRTPDEGADTIIWLATTPELPNPAGGYFEDRAEGSSSRHARDDDMAKQLWSVTTELLDGSSSS